MDIRKWISLSMVISIGVSSATEPDWSCDFKVDKCGIIEEKGIWIRLTSAGGLLYPYASGLANAGDIAIFSIPFDFTSSEGNLSFEYLIADGNGDTLSVTVCQGDVIPAFTRGGSPPRNSTLVPYSCANESDVQIRFIATRGQSFKIYVFNIRIFQMPIVAPATTPPPQTLPTLTSTNTDSTESQSTNTAKVSLAPNQTDVFTASSKIDESTAESTTTFAVRDKSSTPSPMRRSMPWLIPVVASVVVLLLIIIVALVLLYCHRQRKSGKQGPTDGGTTNEPNPDIDHYADYQRNRRPGNYESVGNGRVNGSPAQSDNDTDKHPEAYESVGDASDVKNDDRVGNPVYDGIYPTSERDEDGRCPPLIINPIYNGMDIGKQDSAPCGDLVDNPLYGDQRDTPQGERLNVNLGNGRVEDGGPQHLAKGSVLYALANK